MRVACFSAKAYDRTALNAANAALGRHDLVFLDAALSLATVELAAGFPGYACSSTITPTTRY